MQHSLKRLTILRTIRRVLTSKIFLIPAVVLLVYALLGFFAAPAVVRWYVPKYAREQLKSEARIGKVRINPFMLTFEANWFYLTGPDGQPITSFDRLFLDLQPSGLVNWAIKLKEFRIQKPVVNVVIHKDGELNLTRLIPESEDSEPEEPSTSDPVRLILQRASIADGNVTVTDRRQSDPETLELANLNLNLETVSTIRDRDGTYSLSAKTEKGETIEWQGDITLFPLRSSGKLACLDVQTETLWNFVRDSLNIDAPMGKIDVGTDYRFDAGSTPSQLTLENIRTNLSGLSLKLAGTEQPFFELGKLAIDSARFDLVQRTFQVNRLLLDEGTVRLLIDKAGTSNLQKVARQTPVKESGQKTPSSDEASAQPASAAEDRPWKLAVDAVEMKGLGLSLEDLSRTSPLAAEILDSSMHFKAAIEAGSKTNAVVRQIAVDLEGLHFGSKGAAEPLFEARQFTLEGGEADLAAQSITVDRIGLNDGRIDVGQKQDGTIDLMSIFAPLNEAPEPSGSMPETSEALPWKFLVKAFEITGFRSALSDETVLAEKPLYQMLNINVRAAEIDGRSPFGIEGGFDLEQGGKVSLQCKVDPSAPAIEAKLNAAEVALTPLQPYLDPYIALTLQSAALSTEGAFRYGLSESGAAMAYDGSLKLADLSLGEPGSEETYLGWGAMEIPQLSQTLDPNELNINEIKLSKPTGSLIIAEDGTVNLAKLLKEQPVEEPPSTPPKASSEAAPDGSAKNGPETTEAPGTEDGSTFPYNIGKVQVEEGDLTFADFSLRPQFKTRIHGLKGTVSKISSNKDEIAQINLDGRVDRYGFARITGALDLNDFKRSTDISMIFKNLEMSSITPYSGKFAGRKIESGKLSTDLKYKIQNSRMVGDNQIIVDNLVLGEHVDSPDAVNLPLDLAVALLSDSNGRIDIGLPVTGNLDEPQFSIGPLIWKALTTFITKVATAPFRALGSLLGGEEEKLDSVAFEPGKTEILPPEKEKLEKIAEALEKRPQLVLVVQGRTSTETDGLELRKSNVDRAVALRAGEKLSADEAPEPLDFGDSKTQDALEKIFAERFGNPALDELDRAVREGKIKPRPAEERETDQAGDKKRGRLSRIVRGLKLYRLVPGAKSPEQAELLASEIYARLVENEPTPEKQLHQLAVDRAQLVVTDLQDSFGISADRLATKDPDPSAQDAEPSAGFALDVHSASP